MALLRSGRAESLKAKIQWLKSTARGYRNRDRFGDAIYFHLGGLDLHPAAIKQLSATRTKA